MKKDVKGGRRYDSSRRREQAHATRRAVLDAARDLFIENGYVRTTIDMISLRAGVSSETVYATFKNKWSVLKAVVDVSIVGDDAPVPLLDRTWVQEMRDQPDPRKRADILAENGRLILDRLAPLYDVLRSAAAADRKVGELWETNKAQRFAGQRELLGILIGDGDLREGLTMNMAADILFAVGSPETYRLLVVDRGWSSDRFQRWYSEALVSLLLG